VLRQFYSDLRRSPDVGLSAGDAETYRAHRDRCYSAVGLDSYEDALGQPRQALDVGCGNGLNLDVLGIRGWRVEGIDPNPQQVAALRRDNRCATVADLQQAADDRKRWGRYHLVTMLHLVEHVSDPLVTVRSLARLLRVGGLLVLETPLCCDFANPDHLFFFGGTSMHILLERAGFRWKSHLLYIAHGYAHDNLLVLAVRDER